MNAIDFFKEEDPGNNYEYSKDTRNWLYDKNDMVMFAERYHQAKLKLLGISNAEERNKHLFDFLDYWKIKMGGSFTTAILEKSIKQYLEGK